MNSTVLNGLDGVGDLQQLARGFLGICVGPGVSNFIGPPVVREIARHAPT